VFNVGLGSPISVMEVLNTFGKKNKIKLNILIKEKRFGDLPVSYCNNKKITTKIGWVPKYNYADACEHTWKYYNTYY
jgi:UDP-glucose 4-epimerase